ncbi:MAG: DUF1501 domain-containing protein [Capsulimonadales bacterium]|nr:DUF1501 domain-containing protein [Capsulimonadales bacterium]
MQRPPHFGNAHSRRDFLLRAGVGFGSLALSALLAEEAQATDGRPGPLSPKRPMVPARAKSVIFLFMYGGPSQMDTFDPKPELTRFDGKTMKVALPNAGEVKTFGGANSGSVPLMKSPFAFKKYGKSGIEVSELYPHVGECVDDICFFRSIYGDSNNHAPALFEMNTGTILQGSPAMGSWVTYGLGSENRNLPGFVVMLDSRGGPIGGAPNWASGYMPATYQGTVFRAAGTPILDLKPGKGVSDASQKADLEFLGRLNREHLAARPGDSELEARIASYELAYRMQMSAPEAVDLSKESEETKALYGLDRPETEEFGRKCLLARRLVERGVRFIQLYSGGGHGDDTWDAHGDIVGNHRKHAGSTDKPIAGLLTDLKRRGLLDSTLIIWAGEFGRMPISQGGSGRDHNPGVQTVWMAGGGIKGGQVIGSSDDVGYKTGNDPYHIRDMHATVLRAVGLDDMKLTYLFNGRFQRLTGNGGVVIRNALA